MPMGDIIRRSALRQPEKTALVYGPEMLSYRQLNERVNRLANSLLGMGFQKGDRIAVIAKNSPRYYEIYYAAAKIGGVFVPVNNLLKRKELEQVLAYIRPGVVMLGREFQDELACLGQSADSIRHVVLLESGGSTGVFYERLIEKGEPSEPEVSVDDTDIMSIFLTSGTTGKPKGAMRTHRHVFINAMVGTIEFNLRPDDRTMIVFPFYHVPWEDNMRHVLMANTIVIKKSGSFDPDEVLGLLAHEKITTCQFVPTMINALLQFQNIDSYDLSALRLMVYAASPMPVELLKRAMGRFQCQFLQMYGQTETGPIALMLKPEDHVLNGSKEKTARLASAGKPVLHYEARIVDEEGADVPVGDVGELIVRSESMTVGYWEMTEETAKTIVGGWLYTGDYCRADEEGYIYIVDRKNDLIISGGKNIYPREVEEVLYMHPAVMEATVVGVPDEHWGEAVKAVVVTRTGAHATEEEIISFCKENMASYKKPKTVEFRDALPKSPAGKILKRIVRDEYWRNRDRKV